MKVLALVVEEVSPPIGAVPVRRVARADVGFSVAAAIEDGVDRIGVAGSDADIAVAASTVADAAADVDIAILGSGDLARMFALSPEDGMRRLLEGEPYAIDLGVARGSWGRRVFVTSVVCGLPAASPRLNALAPVRRGSVTISGRREWRVDGAVGAFVMNGQVWRGQPIAPRATLVDGAVDIQVLSTARLKLASLRMALATGSHASRPDVTRRSARRATLEVPRRWPVRVDGDHVGRGGFSVATLPSAVRILI